MKTENIQKLLNLTEQTEASLKFGNDCYSLVIEADAQCARNCPAGVNIKSYIGLIAGKDYDKALDVIREANPFPGVCGRVCTHPCESNCQYPDKNNTISIRQLKRFAADYEISYKHEKAYPCQQKYKEKIAVIGAGPAGLTAAVDLVRLGYRVTVFEAMEKAGGILAWGIPEFRLPSDIVEYEIARIESLGVRIELNTRIDNPKDLLNNGFGAVVIASGAWKNMKLGIEGEDIPGVEDCLAFLRKSRARQLGSISGKVIVIGGGNSAMDAARTAIRLGAGKVTVAYRRTESEMPADKNEIAEAKNEGIEFRTLVIPEKIIGDTRIKEIEFIEAKLGEPDESGRRKPVPVKGSNFKISCDMLIPAISSKPDLQPCDKSGISITENGLIKTDDNLHTSIKKIFATGDVVLGPATVVDVIGNAHKCAASVHRTLRRIKKLKPDKRYSAVIKSSDEICTSCYKAKALPLPARMEHPENEVEPALSEFDAVNEASRCRKCASCYECDICMPACVYKNALLTDKSGSYLLKLPKKLSREIYDSENASCTISVSGRKEKQFTVTALTPRIDRDYCIACGRCASSCAYRAIRAELSLNDSAYYKIEHDICRSCGRCVSVCPSQAITLDRFTDSELEADILTSLHHNNGIVVFGSHWDMDVYNGEDRVIEMMSSECVSPLLIIHTLSLGAKAVVILNGMNPHYLPADSEVPGIVSSVKELLVLSGINTERVAFCQPDEAARILPWVKETFRYHAPETFSNSNVNRLMRTCFELSEYTAHTSFPANNLELHNKVLLAAKVPDYSSLIESINYLSLKFRLGMISPDYEDIQNVGFMKYLSGKLPQLSLKKPSVIGVHNEFMPIQYVEIITSILAGVRNCAVISIPDPGQISSDHITITSDSRKKAVSIFRTAERLGADTVITTSPMCLAWLKAINNPLTLQISSVSVTDIFTFIADIIKEADNE